ncbi:MAG: YgaP-like transmembrane domain, partial [Caldimonas sp.]
MIQNVGTLDRVIRILAGAALIAATVLGFIGAWGWLG